MKFRGLRAFIDSDVVRWAKMELNLALKDLFYGLNFLSFADNFDSFTWTGTIASGAEEAITNNLEGKRNEAAPIPTMFLVVRNSAGQAIGDGPTDWTDENVYIKNFGTASTTVTVIFFK